MADFAFDPTILPSFSEKKGSLLLRSNHMKYSRGVLDSKWHEDRESQPMEYDIGNCKTTRDRDLLKAAYHRLGNVTDGSMKEAQTTQQETMSEVGKLKDDYKTRETHKTLVTYDNFITVPLERDTGRPEQGYGSVLPRHPPDYRKSHMITSHMIDFQYPFEWTPKSPSKSEEPDSRFGRTISEFADTDGHKRFGINTFKDCAGSANTEVPGSPA